MRELKLDLFSLYPDQKDTGPYDYSILVDEVDVGAFSCESYGVAVTSRLTGERDHVPNITVSVPRIDALMDLLVRNQVGPIHLRVQCHSLSGSPRFFLAPTAEVCYTFLDFSRKAGVPMALPKLVVILGPTACGKSGLGVTLTRKYHLLDVAEPGEQYSVARFQQEAYAALDGVVGRGKLPFLVGGTGLYLRAVAEGYVFHEAPPDPGLRLELEALPTEALRARLLDAGVELDVDAWNNRPRLVRLSEKLRMGGDPRAEAERAPRYDVLTLGVTYPREVVCARIDRRLLARLDAGMVEEVASLREQGVSDEFLYGLGLEYRYILRHLTGELSREELTDELGKAIKRFAKRQVSWFKKDRDVHWLDMENTPLAEASALIDGFLS